ncbi:MAG TPA: tRNA (adenosine(37)-N6)-threonylcarbamoyltransferase complex dimerization subunit type 1 TsaB, partial [Candidatus Polarisedimenticolaceae bacterium]|nr:tRNA (adenosine(37)-N6)-threonylcarbamoyltransferase complex dimerization subunit type 1 TsaB [Candidatus Polarisedimenticolaceae bacterium]
AARLLPLVDLTVAAAAWDRASIDLYAAARGPGSFTGIRVGLGLLAGWALASGKPCVGIGTLDAVAEAYGPAAVDRIPLIPAGRGNLYRARFDASSSPPTPLSPPWAGPPERALEGEAGGVVLLPRDLLFPAVPAGFRLAPAPTSIAAAVGRLAALRLAAGLTPEDAPVPLYVRPSYAEAKSS